MIDCYVSINIGFIYCSRLNIGNTILFTMFLFVLSCSSDQNKSLPDSDILNSFNNVSDGEEGVWEDEGDHLVLRLPEKFLNGLYDDNLINSSGYIKGYRPSDRFNPFYLVGDYNMDGIEDLVLMGENGEVDESAIIYMFYDEDEPKLHVIELNTDFAGMVDTLDNLEMFDYWISSDLMADKNCNIYNMEREVSIVLGKQESSSLLLFWKENTLNISFCLLAD